MVSAGQQLQFLQWRAMGQMMCKSAVRSRAELLSKPLDMAKHALGVLPLAALPALQCTCRAVQAAVSQLHETVWQQLACGFPGMQTCPGCDLACKYLLQLAALWLHAAQATAGGCSARGRCHQSPAAGI